MSNQQTKKRVIYALFVRCFQLFNFNFYCTIYFCKNKKWWMKGTKKVEFEIVAEFRVSPKRTVRSVRFGKDYHRTGKKRSGGEGVCLRER